MRDIERVVSTVAEAFRFGTVERDGGIDLWRVSSIRSAGKRRVSWITLGKDGRLAACTTWRQVGGEHVPPGEGEGRETSLGMHLVKLLNALGRMYDDTNSGHDGGIVDPGHLASIHMEDASEAECEAVARRAVLDPLAKSADRLLGRLDPAMLGTFVAYPRLYHHTDGMWGEPGRISPLPAALALHPGFPNAICAMHRKGGPGPIAEAVASGRLSQALAGFMRDEGPADARLLPVAARAERALAGRVRETVRPLGGWHRVGNELRDLFMPAVYEPDWPVALATRLNSFPASWVPSDDGQWWALARLWPVMEQVARMYAEPSMAAAFPSGGDWERLLARLLAAAEVDGPEGLCRAVGNVGDMVSAYEMQVLAAAVHADGSQPRPPHPEDDDADHLDGQASAILLGGRSLPRVLEMSADWHRRQHGMRAAMAAMPGALAAGRWPAGLPDATFGDIEVKVLSDAEALAAEGAPGRDADGVPGLDNCVGGYDADCMRGMCRVVSLRRRHPDETWARLSLAEVSLHGVPAYEILQHVGRSNEAPPAETQAVLERYLDGCRRGSIPCDTGAFAPVPGAEGTPAARACGFDPRVEATRVAMARMWDRYVSVPLRGLDREAVHGLPHGDDLRRWPDAMPVAVPRIDPVHGNDPHDDADPGPGPGFPF